jgi:hypothetical protein
MRVWLQEAVGASARVESERGKEIWCVSLCTRVVFFLFLLSLLHFFSETSSSSFERKKSEKRFLVPPRARAPTPKQSMFPFALGSKEHAAAVSSVRVDEKHGKKAFMLPVSATPSPSPASSSSSAVSHSGDRSSSSLALCLTLALVAVTIVASGSRSEILGASNSWAQRQEQEQKLLQRHPLPPADSAVIAAVLSRKAGTGFPLAVVRKPLLTSAELLTLQHYARGSSYVEWGSGASTVLAAPLARRAVSIENQKSWCDEMIASLDVDFWIKDGVLTYLCVDTGVTGRFGTPTGKSDPKLFINYLDALDEAAAAVLPSRASANRGGEEQSEEEENTTSTAASASASAAAAASAAASNVKTSSTNAFTVVLVDGRFRVACALKALWHLDHARGVLLVHDWVGRPGKYHAPILKRYSLVAVVHRLAVLVPSSPEIGDEAGASDSSDGDEEARVRWWSEAAAEMDQYSRDAA